MRFLVTGGAGFIGSSLIRYLINHTDHEVINVDKLTYAGNLESLASVEQNSRYTFVQVDICDQLAMQQVFQKYKPHRVMHLAAESHVDRSIDGPAEFIQTNIIGTYSLLEVTRAHYLSLSDDEQVQFRLHHVSTDEVYGDLDNQSDLFTEDTAYNPSSPYSASKASSDHLVRAWHRTYGLPVIVSNCSNNYGPFHFPEKLIPLVILNALEGREIPVYGDGQQVRDWLYVEDHARALYCVVSRGSVGETYNIGGHNEKTNLSVVEEICAILDEIAADSRPAHIDSYSELIRFVADRPGHDLRYAIDASKMEDDLDWRPMETFETGIRKTVEWYIDNRHWANHVQDGSYARKRLGRKS